MSSTSWASEFELVEALERRLTEKSLAKPAKRLRVFREFDAGLGRVDLLCVWYDEGRLAARKATHRAADCEQFTLLAGYAMTFLSRSRWVDVSRLQQALRISTPRSARLLQLLSARGLVERREGLIRARPLSSLWFIDAIEAYEAKLDKWKDAAEQATRHLWFVSRSYVAMPALSDKVLHQVIETCRQWYLGLCVLPDSDSCRVKYPPLRRKAPITQLGWLVNERLLEEG